MEELIEKIACLVSLVREKTPLVDCVTNYVTVNNCANILLAFGASPAMIDARDDARMFAAISGALYINTGTFLKEQESAALEAALGAKAAGIPIVVDPVACGAIPRRAEFVRRICKEPGVAIIKGNAGEIMSLWGKNAGETNAAVRGVDSPGEAQGIEEACTELAREFHCVVSATGKIDTLSDGARTVHIHNGCDMLTRITGAGCMAGALCGATVAVCPESPLAAAAAGIMSLALAGEMAYEKARLPGSFQAALMDAIYQITPEILKEKGRLS